MARKIRFCADCGSQIWDTSKRCGTCAKKGKKNPFWKGGRRVNGDGYAAIRMPGHPHASPVGYVLEHRLVMEKKIGRYLETREVVHHINRDKLDNRVENLEIRDNAEHLHAHMLEWKKAKESAK